MDYRNNIFTFAAKQDAVEFVDKVSQILWDYRQVTLTDLYELVEDYDSCGSLSNKVVWLVETIYPTEKTISPQYDSYKDWWYVKFPEPDQYPAQPAEKNYKDFYSEYRRTTTPHSIRYVKETPTPEPLNITVIVDMDPLKDPYSTIREVIQQANEIKDRPVFITIN